MVQIQVFELQFYFLSSRIFSYLQKQTEGKFVASKTQRQVHQRETALNNQHVQQAMLPNQRSTAITSNPTTTTGATDATTTTKLYPLRPKDLKWHLQLRESRL